jgi:hypothetical protein
MRLRSLTTFALAASAMISAFACSADSPAAPKSTIAPANSSSADLLGGLLGGGSTTSVNVVPLLRTTPLASDIVVSKTIGALGGTITVPNAGLTIVVPPLAVGKNTAFKITARKGAYLAYDMEPHGTKFLVPLVATQSLANTNARGILNLKLSLGYYTDPSKITTVSELLAVQLDLLKLTSVTTIPHFSGYIYVTGREDGMNEEF